MKHIGTLTLILFSAITLFGQSIPKKKTMPLIHKKTATWCRPCGTWGWELQKEIIDENKDKALILKIHTTTSDMETTLMNALNNSFESNSGVPNWYVQGKNVTVTAQSGGIYSEHTKDTIKAFTDSVYDLVPDLSSSFSFELNGRELTVNTKTKFFKTVSDEYYLGVYLVSDSVINRQYVTGGYQIRNHDGILTAVINSTNNFGESISTGSTAAETEIDKTYTYTIPTSYNLAKMYIALMMFKKVGAKYEIINTSHTGKYLTDPDPSTKTFTMDCSKVVKDGNLKENKTASFVSFSIPYQNTKSGDMVDEININSTSVTGLSAKLDVLNLDSDGLLVFDVSGTPTLNGNAHFEVKVKTETCSIQLPVEKATSQSVDSFHSSVTLPGKNDDKVKDIGGNFNLEKDETYVWEVVDVNIPQTWTLKTVCDNVLCYDYPANTSKEFTATGSSADDYIKLTIENNLNPGYGYVNLKVSKKNSSNPSDSRIYKFSLAVSATGSIKPSANSDEFQIAYYNKYLSFDQRLVDNSTLKVYDLPGKELVNSPIQSNTMNLDKIRNGIYIIQISQRERLIKSQKIHIQ